jgi:Mg-chelatase subunit ChlD
LSPVLANVYLHYALDKWFENEVLPQLTGFARLVRYADDFVVCFEKEAEARAFGDDLRRRMGEFGRCACTRAKRYGRKERRTKSDLSVVIKTQDIREKIRVGKVSTATMFVVDASGSMGANRRMESAKGAVLSLLLDSYQQRDKVGLVVFRGNQANVLLPLCSSVDLAYKGLKELPTGGRTPLAAGLERGLNLLMAEKQKDEGAIPVLLLISDGRANVSSSEKDIKIELLALAEQARTKGIHVIVN